MAVRFESITSFFKRRQASNASTNTTSGEANIQAGYFIQGGYSVPMENNLAVEETYIIVGGFTIPLENEENGANTQGPQPAAGANEPLYMAMGTHETRGMVTAEEQIANSKIEGAGALLPSATNTASAAVEILAAKVTRREGGGAKEGSLQESNNEKGRDIPIPSP